MPNGGTLEQAKQIEEMMLRELGWLWPVGARSFFRARTLREAQHEYLRGDERTQNLEQRAG